MQSEQLSPTQICSGVNPTEFNGIYSQENVPKTTTLATGSLGSLPAPGNMPKARGSYTGLTRPVFSRSSWFSSLPSSLALCGARVHVNDQIVLRQTTSFYAQKSDPNRAIWGILKSDLRSCYYYFFKKSISCTCLQVEELRSEDTPLFV